MRQAIHNLEASKIREVANAGMGRSDVLAFWFGESDEVTPEFIRQAAIDRCSRAKPSMRTTSGLPELREAVAALHERAASARSTPARIAITSGGVNALMLAVQALVDAGDEVVAVTPVWPNLTAQPAILGAQRALRAAGAEGGAWTLDLDALRAAVTPATQAADRQCAQQPDRLDADARRAAGHPRPLPRAPAPGSWPTRSTSGCTYEPTPNGCAPSFLDVAAPDDRLVVAHSFSKSFLMTGWRLGWLVLPPALMDGMGKLIEFNTSCASVFTQRAGIAALRAPTRSRRAWSRT